MKQFAMLALGLAAVLAGPALSAQQPPAALPAAAAPVSPAPAKPAAKEPAQFTVADFARLPFIEQARLSPTGKRVAGLMAQNGIQTITIYHLFDKSEKPFQIRLPDGTEASWIRWVNEDNIIVGLYALLPVDGEKIYVSRMIGINRISSKLTRLFWDSQGQNAANVLWLPSDGSAEILVSVQNSFYLDEQFWPSVNRINVETGRSRKVEDGRPSVMDWYVDSAGRIRAGLGYNDTNRTFRLLYRGESDKTLRTIDRADTRKDEQLLDPFLFLPGSNRALTLSDDDKGMSAIYEVDLLNQADKKIRHAAPPGHEITHAVLTQDGSGLLGYGTNEGRSKMHWQDPALAALQAEFDKSVPDYTVRIVSFSNDRSRLLVQIDRPDTPGSIYYFDTADGRLQRLAFSSEALGSRRLSPVKMIRYKARDGLEIEAVLTLPKNKPAKSLPIVILPHGGPWGHDTLNYDYWAQFVASRGYAVLQPNFRGSTGYGTPFMEAGKGQLGLAMQDDVSDALRWAATEGIADPKRACIMGGSYGGYAAMWGAAKDPDLYRCAISIAGVANLRREVNDFGRYSMGGKFKDDWKAMTPDFAAVSPINAVARIKAPLLLIHGKKDVTVDVGQSNSMNNKMREAGKQVEYLPLPEADHYFTRQADREALLSAVERFLAKHNPAN